MLSECVSEPRIKRCEDKREEMRKQKEKYGKKAGERMEKSKGATTEKMNRKRGVCK